ncbi:nucleotide-binding protein [Candidatus Micrarchaeota archaeon]|nr:nucleotide-binding protein [Candidatus Micrarchaeota archaeon]
MKTKEIILDTNFLLVPFQFKIDIFSELNYLIEDNFVFVVPTGVVSELKKLSKGRGKEGAAARFALKIIEVYVNTKKIKTVKSNGFVDDWIMKIVKSENPVVVCTNDTNLRLRLKKAKVPVITLKSRSKIGFA